MQIKECCADLCTKMLPTLNMNESSDLLIIMSHAKFVTIISVC